MSKLCKVIIIDAKRCKRWIENCGKVTTKSLIQFKKLLIKTDPVPQYVDKSKQITGEKGDSMIFPIGRY